MDVTIDYVTVNQVVPCLSLHAEFTVFLSLEPVSYGAVALEVSRWLLSAEARGRHEAAAMLVLKIIL